MSFTNPKSVSCRFSESGHALKFDKEYQNLLHELQSIIAKSQYAAYKAVDNIRVQTYWQIGERIVREEFKNKERADYGQFLVVNISSDLNIKRQELYKIVKFYRVYPNVGLVTRQLSWTHYYYLLDINEEKKRKFYEQNCVLYSWGVKELRKQLKSNLYETTSPQEIKDTLKTTLPAVAPNEIFKDTYDFNFIELPTKPDEKTLEDNLINNIEMFLKEIGPDFYFGGRQIPIKIDNQTHSIDLVLYHRGIPCIVLVDLKSGKLDSRDIGQMNKYIGYYRKNRQYPHEKDTIGLIICQYAGQEEVVYALDGLEEKIFIAQYKVKLPSEEKIRNAIRDL